MSNQKYYLGDGAYVDFDGYALILTAENGIEATNTIVLEPQVYAALVAYVEELRIRRQVAQHMRDQEPVPDPERPS